MYWYIGVLVIGHWIRVKCYVLSAKRGSVAKRRMSKSFTNHHSPFTLIGGRALALHSGNEFPLPKNRVAKQRLPKSFTIHHSPFTKFAGPKSRLQKFALQSNTSKSNIQNPTFIINRVARQRLPKFSILNSQFSIKKRFLTPHSSLFTFPPKEETNVSA